MKTSLLVLSADDVQHLVQTSLELREAVRCVARAFELMSGPEAQARTTLEHNRVQQPWMTTVSPGHDTFYMSCRLPAPMTPESPIQTAIKVVSVSRRGGEGGIPATTLVLDEQTGATKAVVNSRVLTALRNAAGSVLATQLLGTRTPTHITLFGAGLQARHHARMFIHTYPSITRCTIVNRSANDRLNNLISHLSSEFPQVQIQGLASSVGPPSKIEAAVREADVICTATPSIVPLFDSSLVKPGAHINLIGSYSSSMREVDSNLIVKRAGRRIVVDEAKSCVEDAGELVDAGIRENELVEIGVLVGGVEGEMYRQKVKESGDVTVFKSLGVAVQDVAIAALIVELAERDGKIGARIPYD
ncbi:ornithine carbamoyltransferase [Ceratobasidium sp. AG-Ba]|nr:ornithine carbamoyltransferase [Ceratobasidium sp. AG-Ba]